MNNDIYDIAVIGLGVAGSVFAASIDSRFSVIAIDRKSNNSDSFRKPCGGLLAPDAQKALAELGLNLSKDILVDPQIFSVRTIDLDNMLTRNYQRMYINLDRHKFDLWLSSLLPESIDKRTDAVVTDIIHENDMYRVCFNEHGVYSEICAKILIGADGANSSVRRMLYPKLHLRSYTAIQQWFTETNPEPFYSCIFDRKHTDCYSWSISKDGCFIFGGAYPKKNSRASFEEQKEKLTGMGFSFGEPLKTEACLVLRPKGMRSFRFGYNNVFLIGEAAGFISPSSLEGISSAIISASSLVRILNKGKRNSLGAYKKATFPVRIKLSFKLIKCPFMYNPFLRSLAMKSGINAISVNKES